MAIGFLGMKGTGTFDDMDPDLRPKNWRQMLLRLYPNGDAPLTAILSMMGEESTDDPEFNWWTKALPLQGGAILGISATNAGTGTYTGGSGVLGTVVYFQVSPDVASEFRLGHQVLVQVVADPDADVNGKLVSKTPIGPVVVLGVSLLEADDNSSENDLSNADYIQIIGNINAEGAPMPDSVSYKPTKFRNLTQIFRTPLDITRTAQKTRLRTEANYEEMKREALELHGIEMEMAFIWSIMTEQPHPVTGQPERTTNGIIPFIRANAPQNIDNYTLNDDDLYKGKTWLQAGETWLNNLLEQIFTYGKEEKLALVGNGVLNGINRLVMAGAKINITPRQKVYGIEVMEWVTSFGVLYLKRHPLFSQRAQMRNSALILEPKNLSYRFIDDTFFKGDPDGWKRGGRPGYDAKSEEYLTECGLELHHPQTFGLLSGIGLDNDLS